MESPSLPSHIRRPLRLLASYSRPHLNDKFDRSRCLESLQIDSLPRIDDRRHSSNSVSLCGWYDWKG
jgi:hypothetical protein